MFSSTKAQLLTQIKEYKFILQVSHSAESKQKQYERVKCAAQLGASLQELRLVLGIDDADAVPGYPEESEYIAKLMCDEKIESKDNMLAMRKDYFQHRILKDKDHHERLFNHLLNYQKFVNDELKEITLSESFVQKYLDYPGIELNENVRHLKVKIYQARIDKEIPALKKSISAWWCKETEWKESTARSESLMSDLMNLHRLGESVEKYLSILPLGVSCQLQEKLSEPKSSHVNKP